MRTSERYARHNLGDNHTLQSSVTKLAELRLARAKQEKPQLRAITAQRGALPIAGFRQQIMSLMESNQVIMVAGETGCGKTTQVPQFILDDMWAAGKSCRVVRPRRGPPAVSATPLSPCPTGRHNLTFVGHVVATIGSCSLNHQ